jgi:hypothetical protein
MKFFVPEAENEEQAERVYQSVREFVAEQAMPLDDRRIFSIKYTHDGTQYYAEVGQTHALNGERVIAILKARNYGLYYVCTPNRGVVRGGPILVGEHHTISTVDFAD